MQFTHPICSLQCYDFKCNLKVWYLLFFFVYRMWRGTAGVPEWIWYQKHSDSKTERWFGHNVESARARIAAEVRTVWSSFVWGDACEKLEWNRVLMVTGKCCAEVKGIVAVREAWLVGITSSENCVRMFVSSVKVPEQSLQQRTAWSRPLNYEFYRVLTRKSITSCTYADALIAPSCTYTGRVWGKGVKLIFS